MMFKVVTIALLISVVAHAMPASVDESENPQVANVIQSNQAVVEQEPKIATVFESDVEMSEQNKEAMENAETFGFGYHRTFYPRVYPIVSYPVVPHHGFYGYPIHYAHTLHYY